MTTTRRATGIARTTGTRGIVSLLTVAMVAALLAVSSPVGALEPTGWRPVVGDISDGLGRDLAAVDAALISGGNGRAWALPQTAEGWGDREALVPAAGTQSSDYGATVGIAESPSGDRRFAVVGDPGAASDVGASHLFEWTAATGWRSLADLTPDVALADGRFGTAVDVSYLDDKTAILAVSAALDRSGTGVVFTYVIRESVVGAAEPVRAVTTDATDLFGSDLALDGARLVVGAPRDDDEGSTGPLAGTASVFDADAAVIAGGAALAGFTETARLSQCGSTTAGGTINACGTSSGEGFGHSVAIDGDVIVAGAWLASQAGGGDAGEVDVFRRVAGTWTLEQRLNSSESVPTDRLGSTVAVQGDRIAASAWNRDSGTGAVINYGFDGTTWTENAPAVRPDDSAPGDRVGQGLAFTDGVLSIGAPGNAAGGRDAGRITTRSLTPVSNATVAFRTTEVLVNETDGEAVLSVAITGTVAQQSVALWMAAPADEPGFDPAGPGDYTAMGVMVLSPGATTAELRVPVIDDDVYERPEAFEVTIASIDDPGISIGATPTALVTVLEDPTDLPGLSIAGTLAGAEGSDLALELVLDRAAEFDLAIPLFALAGSSRGFPSDVAFSSNTVVVDAGETRAPFTLTLVDDLDEEGTETVRLLAGPVADEPDATELGIVTITDDDLVFTLPGLLDGLGGLFELPVDTFYENGQLRVDQVVDLATAQFDGFGLIDAVADITVGEEVNNGGIGVPGADEGGIPPGSPLDGRLDASLVVDALDVDLPFATIFDRTDAATTADPISLAGIELGAPDPWLQITDGSVSASYTGSIRELEVSGAVRIDDVDGSLVFDDDLASATVTGMSGEVGSDGRATLSATTVAGTFAGVDVTLSDATVRLDPDRAVPFLEADAADVGPFGINGLRIFRDGTFAIDGGCVAVSEMLGAAGLGGSLPVQITSACVQSTGDDGTRVVDIEGTYDLSGLDALWSAPVTVRVGGVEIADGGSFAISVELAPGADGSSLFTPIDLPAIEIELALDPTSPTSPGIRGTALLSLPAYAAGVAQGPITVSLDAQPELPGVGGQITAAGTGTLTIDDAAAGQGSLAFDIAISGTGAVDNLLDITNISGTLAGSVNFDGGRPVAAAAALTGVEIDGTVTAVGLADASGSPIEVRGAWNGTAWQLEVDQSEARLGALVVRNLQLDLRGTAAGLTVAGSAELALDIDGNGDGTVEGTASPLDISFAREGDTLRITGTSGLTEGRIAEVLTVADATATTDVTVSLTGGAPSGSITVAAAELGLFPDADGTPLASLTDPTVTVDTAGNFLVAATRLESTLLQAGVTATIDAPTLFFGPLPQAAPVLTAEGGQIAAVDGDGIVVEIGGLQLFRDGTFTLDSVCVSADDLLGEIGVSGIVPIIVTQACIRSTDPDSGTRRIEIDGTFDLDAGLASWPGAPTVALDGAPIADGDPIQIAVDVSPANGAAGLVQPVDLPSITITTTDPGLAGLDGTLTVTTPAVVDGTPQGPITATVDGNLDVPGATASFSAAATGSVVLNADDTATLLLSATGSATGSIADIATVTEASGSIDLAIGIADGRATAVLVNSAAFAFAGELNAPGLTDGSDPLDFTGSHDADAGVWTLEIREDTATVDALTIEELAIDVTVSTDTVTVAGSGRMSLQVDGDGDGSTTDSPVPISLAITGNSSAITLTATFGPVPTLAIGDVFVVTGATGFGTITIDPAQPAPTGSIVVGGVTARWFPDGDDELAELNEPELHFDLDGSLTVTGSQFTSTALGDGITATITAPTLTFTAAVPQVAPVFRAASGEITATDINGAITLEDLAVFRDGTIELGSICAAADDGLLGAFGLAGILPFEVTEACAIADDGDDTLVEITGYFDLDRLADWPFTTTITLDPDGTPRVVTDEEGDLHTFSVIVNRADPLGSWPRPVDLPPIRIDVADLEIAGEAVSGYLELPGWIDGAETGDFDGDITFADDGEEDEGSDGIVDLDASATVDGDITLTDDGVAGAATITVAASGSVDSAVDELSGTVTVDVTFAADNRDGIDIDVQAALRSAALSGTLDLAGVTGVDASPITVVGSYDTALWRFAVAQDQLTLGGFRAEDVALAVTAGVDGNNDLVVAAEGSATAVIDIDGLDPIRVPIAASAADGVVTIEGGLAIETLALGDLLLLDGTGNDTPGDDPTPDATFSLTIGLDDGAVDVAADLDLPRAVLLPDDEGDEGLVELLGVTGSFSSDGTATIGFDDASIVLGDAIDIDLAGGAITLGDPNVPLLEVSSTTGRIADPDDPDQTLLTVTVTDFAIAADGTVSIGSIEVDDLGPLAEATGVAGVLPFTIDDASITFPEPGDFDAFDLRVGGTFALERLGDLPFTPVIRIGATDVTATDRFDLGVRVASLQEGRIELVDFGEIELGVRDWDVGPLTLDGTLTITSNGDALPTVTGAIGIKGAADDDFTFDANATVTATPVITTTGGTVDIDFGFELTAALSSVLEIERLRGAVGFQLAYDGSAATPRVSVDDLRFDGVLFDRLAVSIGDLVRFVAEDGAFDPLATRGEPIISFADGSLGMEFGQLGDDGEPDPDNPLAGWGGSVGGFEIRNGTTPDGENDDTLDERLPRIVLLDGFSADITVGDLSDLGVEGLPFEVEQLGLTFPGVGDDDGVDLRDADLIPAEGVDLEDLVDDLTDVRIRFTGGVTRSEELSWPITATVDDLEIDLAILKRWLEGDTSELPITNLSGAEFIMDPINLGPIVIGGGFGIGVITTTIDENGDEQPLDTPIWYGRVLGDFAYGSFGLGIELIVSQYGPVAGRLRVPAVVPLGPSTFIVSGARGSLEFDGTRFPRVEIDCEIDEADVETVCSDFELPDIANPMLTDDDIRLKLTDLAATFDVDDTPAQFAQAVARQWAKGFTFTIGGSLTQAAVTGVVSGDITLGANVALDIEGGGADNRLQLIGQGDLTVYGTGLGQVTLILDYSEPLDPIITLGFKAPAGGDLLAMLLPGEAQLVMSLDTEGFYAAPLIGMRALLLELATGAAGNDELAALLLPLVDLVAAQLDANRSSNLGRLVLDGLDPRDVPGTIDGTWLLARLVSGPDPLIPDITSNIDLDEGAFEATFVDDATRAAEVASAFLADLYAAATATAAGGTPPAIGDFVDLSDPDQVSLADRLGISEDASTNGMDIAFAITQVLVDAVTESAATAFAVANPQVVVTGSIQPKLLGIPVGEPTAELAILMTKDEIGMSATGSIKDMTLMVVSACQVCGIALGAASLGPLVNDRTSLNFRAALPFSLEDLLRDGTFPAIDPYKGDWAASVEGELLVAGFAIGELRGLVVPGTVDLSGVNPVVTNFIGDGLALPITDDEIGRINEFGGVLVDGSLQFPTFFADPQGTLDQLDANGPIPSDPLEFLDWVGNGADILGATTDAGGFQLYLPAPVPELGEAISELAALDPIDDADQIQALLSAAGVQGQLDELFSAARIEGIWDLDFLGFPVSDGRVRVGQGTDGTDGLIAEIDFPWLPQTVEFVSRTTDIGTGRDAIPWPTVGGEATITSSQVANMLGNLGLDTGVFNHAGGSATLRAYSPGYDTEGTDLQRTGGVEIELQATIDGLIENATVVLTLTPPTGGGIIPDVSVSLAVDTLTVGTLTINIDDLTFERVGNDVRLMVDGSVEHPLFSGSVSGEIGGTLDFSGSIRVPGTDGTLTASGTIGGNGQVRLDVATTGTLDLGPFGVAGSFGVLGGAGQPFRIFAIDDVTANMPGLGPVTFDDFRVATNGTFAVAANLTFGSNELELVGVNVALERTLDDNDWVLHGTLGGGDLVVGGNAQGEGLPVVTATFPGSSLAINDTFEVPGLDLGPAFVVDPADVTLTGSTSSLRLVLENEVGINGLGGAAGMTLETLDLRSSGFVNGRISGAARVAGTTFGQGTFVVSRSSGGGPITATLSSAAEVDIGGAGNLVLDLDGSFTSDGEFSFSGSSDAGIEVDLGVFGSAEASYDVDIDVDSSGGAARFVADGEVCLPFGRWRVVNPGTFFQYSVPEIASICVDITVDVASNGVIAGSATFPGFGPHVFNFPFNVPAVNSGGTPPTFTDVPNTPIQIVPQVQNGTDIDGEFFFIAEYTPPTAGANAVSCTPASGTPLPQGLYDVRCTAINEFGTSTADFKINIFPLFQALSLTIESGPDEEQEPDKNDRDEPEVPRDGVVTVTGSNAFPGATGRGSIYSERTELATFTVDDDGTWSVDLLIPADIALGQHTVVIEVDDAEGRPTSFQQPVEVVEAPADIECTVTGTEGGDWLVGTFGDDVICGFGGDDVIFGLGGNDLVFGGDGDDVIVGGWGASELRGGRGADTIFSAAAGDTLIGGPDNDHLYGSAGADTIVGGDGDDVIRGGTGNDIADGGDGNDDVRGGPGGDFVLGGDGNDVLRGGGGADIIGGFEGDDVLDGSFGADWLIGGDGVDRLYGGPGDDLLGTDADDAVIDQDGTAPN